MSRIAQFSSYHSCFIAYPSRSAGIHKYEKGSISISTDSPFLVSLINGHDILVMMKSARFRRTVPFSLRKAISLQASVISS